MIKIELLLLKWQQYQNLVHQIFEQTLVNYVRKPRTYDQKPKKLTIQNYSLYCAVLPGRINRRRCNGTCSTDLE